LRNVSWRASPARWRRSAPAVFVRPCEPTLIDHPPTGSDWLHEVKHDGFRVLACKEGERVRLWSRRGADFTDRFARIADPVRGLVADDALIDSEAVLLRAEARWASKASCRSGRAAPTTAGRAEPG
jgi:ATP-dependent DNA ligase